MNVNGSARLADVVNHVPGAMRVLEEAGIDYCCGGDRTLADACSEAGIDVAELVWQIERQQRTTAEAPYDWLEQPLGELVDHIVDHYHAGLREELPLLESRVERVIEAHGERHGPTLRRLQDTLLRLSRELHDHMAKEEHVLFPFVRRLEAESAATGGSTPAGPGASIEAPLTVLEDEHASAGAALARLRELTSGFTPPNDACATFRALYEQLGALERDLHEHIHLENNVLFPRARDLVRGRPAKAG